MQDSQRAYAATEHRPLTMSGCAFLKTPFLGLAKRPELLSKPRYSTQLIDCQGLPFSPRTCVSSLHYRQLSLSPGKTTKLHAAICIVDMGPHGTSTFERLLASTSELFPSGQCLKVHVVDPCPPGPGSEWRISQSPNLLMNVAAGLVTMFSRSHGPMSWADTAGTWFA